MSGVAGRGGSRIASFMAGLAAPQTSTLGLGKRGYAQAHG